ncbi:protein unc-13 homolog 4B isoform X1 [Glossina fuscipes]|uniref:Protein unc-13 homolog 4B isoform X1 n=1 Tax=Glossina fuscipes TaxID=7396 RepID=A0A8U0WFH2_9MUSC|nr:protein unc-13 homolog 4B isoform X1 [Glossina fuscipes]
MNEEQMWKNFYEKLQELKTNPPTEHESRLQDEDGGFFEKFGSLLRQKSHIEENSLKTNLAPFAVESENETEAHEEWQVIKEEESPTSSREELDCAAVQSLELKRDLSIEEVKERKEEFFEKSVGMNIEDLYEEILYEIANNIGCESSDVCRESLIEFAQEAFKISNERHEDILKMAEQKEPPNVRLNVEIIKAENLMPKDSNGFSDPFVTLYLESNGSHRYNSSVKTETLNPVWEEHFSLPVIDNPRKEVLILEVWDFDAAETVKEKVNKLLDVKGVKGLRKLMKEIAMTASTGKHDNELIGRTAITLKSIPVSGCTIWYNLEKGNKTKSRGSILINLALSAEKNKHVAVQEHRHLLKLLLLHELESSQVANFWWNGKFSANGETIRSQHAVQSGLSSFDCALSQWSVYASIHEEHPLSFSLFNSILDVITPVLKCHLNESDDMKTFWDGAKRILPSCFSVLRKLRAKNVSDKQIVKTLCDVLDIFAKVNTLPPPESIDLFPPNIYGWINRAEDSEYNIDRAIEDAIHAGTKEWLEHIIEGNRQPNGEQSDDENLQYLIKLIQMTRSDLQRAMEYFDKHFYHKMRLNFSAVLLKYYDKKLVEIVKSIVSEVCGNIKRLHIPDEQNEALPDLSEINMGTTLFELYLVLKRFLTLGKSLCPNEELAMENFHTWFMTGVTHWLDISVVKALNRIEKAIELDKLVAVDETVKYSSSAVDTLAIFYQIKIFWQQLDWPDAEGSYTFVAKIVDDICRCCVFYAQRMSRRVEDLTKDESELFHVTTEWCLAINNIDYIRQSLPAFIKELGTDDVIKRLGEFRSNLEAERCEITIRNVIENALDTERNQILELLEIVARKMAPPIRRFLAEGAEVLHEDSNSMERLMMYLENSLRTLYNTLNEVNFARILDAIWAELSVIMYDLIQSNLDKRRPPAFFQNLRQTLHVMISCFKTGNMVTSDIEVLTEIERILDLHAFETADLIHQYYLERLGHQKEINKSEYGQLTIRANFNETDLKLEIMNARNLVPMDTNGSCDSFVKAHFLPSNRFLGVSAVKTAVQSKTRFPLYDEQFTIKLTQDQQEKQNSLILFSIKDKDYFGMTNQYIAECYITFADLLANENDQIHMELSRPEYTASETIRALEYRQGDKQAKDFLKKLKNKSYS